MSQKQICEYIFKKGKNKNKRCKTKPRNGNKKWLRMSAKRELNSFRKLANIEIEWLKRDR